MITVGPFEVEERVGAGAMGQVWRGVHARTGTPVAVKFVTAGAADLEEAAASVRREAQAIAGLQHPHVVYVYDQGVVTEQVADELEDVPAGSPWIVMELLSGGTLADRHLESAWPRLRRDLEHILEGLAHCHARGVLHRDLKPSNVLFGSPRDPRPGLKLVDFGIAWQAGGREVQFGTPEFCPPEQLGNEAHAQGPWTDLYAVGAIGWEIATGAVPWAELSGAPLFMAKARGELPVFTPRIDVPEGFGRWLQRAMAGPPGDRFQSAPDALHALGELGGISRSAAPVVRSRERGAQVTRAMVGGEGLAARTDGAPEPAPLVRELIGVPIPPPALRDAGMGLWRFRPAQYTARMPQRVRLWQRLEHAVRDDKVRLASLRGPTGSGRSRTVQWLAEAAQTNGGVLALCAVAGEPGEALTGLLRRILRGHPGDPEGLENARWMLEHHGITYRAVVEAVECWFAAPEDARRVREAVVQLVRSLARGRPVLLVLDDADQDPALVEVALELAKGPRAPMLVVATSAEPLGERFEEVPVLDPLRRREMGQLLTSVLPLAPESVEDVVAGSGGRPGRALALVEQVFEAGHETQGPAGIVLDLEPDPPVALPELPPVALEVLRRSALLGVFPDRRVVVQSFGNQRRAELAVTRTAELGMLDVEGSVIAFAPGVRKAVLAEQGAHWARHHLALGKTLPPESASGALHRIQGGDPEGFRQLSDAVAVLDQRGDLVRLLAHCDAGLQLWDDAKRAPASGPWTFLVRQRAEVLAGLRSPRLADVLEADLRRAWDHEVWDAVAGLCVERAALLRDDASRDLHFALEVAESDAVKARALHGLARHAERDADMPRARYWLHEASALATSPEREAAGQAHIARARLAAMEGDYTQSLVEVEAAIRQRSVPGELDLLAAGVQLASGAQVLARSSLLRGVHWMTQRRDRRWLPTALVRLGLVELLEGHQDQCEARLAEADRIQAENRRQFGGDPSLGAPVRMVLTLERGEWFRAVEALGHCTDLAWQRPTRVAVMRRVREILANRDDVPEPVREAFERELVAFDALKSRWLTR